MLMVSLLLGAVALGLNKEKPKETTLEIYQQCFEEEFIVATEVHYTAESSQFIVANSVADYMKKVLYTSFCCAMLAMCYMLCGHVLIICALLQVETRLAEEVRRVQTYLHPSTEAELIQKCERVLIEKHVETIWNEFHNLLQDDKIEDLTRMYSLLMRIARGLDPLRTILEKHVQTVGEQVGVCVCAPARLVDRVLCAHAHPHACRL